MAAHLRKSGFTIKNVSIAIKKSKIKAEFLVYDRFINIFNI